LAQIGQRTFAGASTVNANISNAALTADWNTVTGAGKPENNATYGADWFTNVIGASAVNTNINQAALTALWDSVTGGGKPENNATLGANNSNLAAGVGSNLCQNSDFLNASSSGWTKYDSTILSDLGVDLGGWYVSGGNTIFLHQNDAGTVGYSELLSTAIPVIPGKSL